MMLFYVIFSSPIKEKVFSQRWSETLSRTHDLSSHRFWPDNTARDGFYLVGVGLGSAQKVVGYSPLFMPLLHQEACLAKSVITVAPRVHSWVIDDDCSPFFRYKAWGEPVTTILINERSIKLTPNNLFYLWMISSINPHLSNFCCNIRLLIQRPTMYQNVQNKRPQSVWF